jgi:DNA invertase Pin-like site-specific DNA recombinase
MRWGAVVEHYVLRKQGHKCPNCGQEIAGDREITLEQKDLRKNGLDIDNWQAVHEQCDPVLKKDIPTREERLERVAELLKARRSRREIMRDLNISYRTLFRYLNAIDRERR